MGQQRRGFRPAAVFTMRVTRGHWRLSMAHQRQPPANPALNRLLGLILIGAMLATGLLLGMDSTLKLTRDASGTVTAENTWRFAGRIPLIKHTVTHLRQVVMLPMNLSESDRRSTAYRNVFGGLVIPDQVTLRGDNEVRYSYQEDFWLIDGFLKNTANREAVFVHPRDIRRTVASWVLLMFGVLSVAGWIVTLILGRDPLAHAPDKVKPLPPKVGGAIFLSTIVFLWWFFVAGQHFFGPLATSKVKLLLDSAQRNNVEGIERAVYRGVFVDARDDQAATALMIAAQAGALEAVDALLRAGANPSLRDLEDRTALLRAIEMNHPRVALRLLEAGVDLTAADTNGRNALHHAAESADAALLHRILQAGAAVNQPDAHGWTALVFAAARDDAESVSVLLAAGADATLKTEDGRTAADLATHDSAVHDLLINAAGKK